ncbi:hypothetical protein D0C16_09450 [Cellvibrio sp. KY-GH-1]|uniref:hypothetical protein n=1 Tax=Cellvibrio sp. KY-GH-1 TaxID=2303332 RepID=UPI001246CF2B|nr:hypothetical protein [Cellvibrio sp. KY-GH-1]QEY16182.1 hypothetical protein D0C16_09450 [Cellvibrio sp. KY-GH-1]
MMFIIGRLLNTLSYRSNKEIKESLYKNEYFIQNRWGFVEGNIVAWSNSFLKYNVLIILLASLVVVNFVEWLPVLKPWVKNMFPNWTALLDWQNEFLAAQLTIVGAIYPLVIGLISVLLQNKSARSVIFLIYQKYSGFMFSGLSGLSLVAFIIVGYFFQSLQSNLINVAFYATSAVWFIFNIILTAWFFAQTFKVINERSRNELVVQFSICESCEFDIRERIKKHLIQDPVGYKMLTVSNEGWLKVGCFWFRESYEELIVNVSGAKRPKDIRFRFVGFAILIQSLVLRLKKITGAEIKIDPMFKSVGGSDFVVAKYIGFKINPIAKFFLINSVSFGKGIG